MAEINVTPLVDVMLVLLIVFMITMPVLTHSIPLQLPRAAAESTAASPKEPLRLSINNKGYYHLNQHPLSLPQLRQALNDAQHHDAEVVLAIAADKQAAYDHIAQALAAAREAGLHRVGFVTEAP